MSQYFGALAIFLVLKSPLISSPTKLLNIVGMHALSIEIFSFIHLMATNFPVLIFYALITSEKVPSPIFDISLYSSKLLWPSGKQCTIHRLKKLLFFILIFDS